MTGRARPPYLRLATVDGEAALDTASTRAAVSTVDDIAAAPMVDAGRVMIDGAVEAVIDAAADFGLMTRNTDVLRREIRTAVTRFVNGWIIDTLIENDDVGGA